MIESSDQPDLIKLIGNNNSSPKSDPCDIVEQLNKSKLKNINRLVIRHLNMNSLPDKFDQLELIIKNKVDILVITRTKLDYSFPESQLIMIAFRKQ